MARAKPWGEMSVEVLRHDAVLHQRQSAAAAKALEEDRMQPQKP